MIIKQQYTTGDEGVAFIENTLKKLRINSAHASVASMTADHAIWHIVGAMDEGDTYEITINKNLFFLDVIVEGVGRKLDFEDEELTKLHKSYQYTRVRGVNRLKFSVEQSDAKDLGFTLLTMVMGVVFGLAIKNVLPANIIDMIDYYGLSLVSAIFMNALKIIVGPLVFFSIAGCISKYTNLKELEKIGIKMVFMYLCTTLIAIFIGFGLYKAFPVGDATLATYYEDNQSDAEITEEYDEVMESKADTDFSIRTMIVNIVPDNALDAFLSVNLLQIIFLAVLVGIGIGRCGEEAVLLNNIMQSFNTLMMRLTEIITKFIPLAIFCAMAKLVIHTGAQAMLSLLSYAALVIGGMLSMLVFYALFIFITTGLNPFIFFKKFIRTMLTAFAVSSSTAAMPATIQSCSDMGIDKRVSSFTIPLGSNINMDGSSMVFMITVMFMCKVFGIDLNGTMILSVIISIVFLALGSPSFAGADLVMIALLLDQVGVPMEAIGIILGIDAIFDMVQAMTNTTGDAAVTLVLAKNEKLLDVEQYYR